MRGRGTIRGLIGAFIAAREGNIAILAALALPVLVAAAALVTDEAALHAQKRSLQSAVDLAAIHAAGDPANALARAHLALIDQGAIDPAVPLETLVDPTTGRLRVVSGRYSPDAGLEVSARFVPGASPPNAVEVSLRAPGTLYFARTFMAEPPTIGVTGLASATPRAAFSIGSRLARLDGGLVNRLLGDLLGTELSLSLLDYEAIARLDVTTLGFLDALAGEIGIAAGTYGDVLGARVRLAEIGLALVAAAGGRDPAALAVLVDLVSKIDETLFVEMSRVIAADGLAALALGTAQAGAAAHLDALEMLTVAALLADGNRQLALDLGLGVPGIAGISARLVVGEPPQGAWYGFGETGSYVRTAQIRLRLDIAVLGHGGAGIGLLDISLPVYAELAYAEARLAAMTCPPGRPELGQAALGVTPGVLRLAVGHTPHAAFLDTRAPLALGRASIVNVAGIARVTARADVRSAQVDPHTVWFTHGDVLARTTRTVSTTTPVASLTRSLVSGLDLRLEIIGLNLLGGLLNGVVGTVGNLLTPVAPALDTSLVALFSILGLSIGEADVRVHGFDCRTATLVQ